MVLFLMRIENNRRGSGRVTREGEETRDVVSEGKGRRVYIISINASLCQRRVERAGSFSPQSHEAVIITTAGSTESPPFISTRN